MTDEYIDLSVCSNWLVVIHIAFNIYTKVKCMKMNITSPSHCPCWFKAPCFQGLKGQPSVITVVTYRVSLNRQDLSVILIQLLL